MKSKKLLLAVSSFLVVGSIVGCNKGAQGDLSAELKTEKTYSVGEKITNDDLRVALRNGNQITELKSDQFTVTEFTNKEYTFKDTDGKIGERSKTFNVTYNNLKTTFNVNAFNGEVSQEEFNNALDNVYYPSSNRNYTLDVTMHGEAGTETQDRKMKVTSVGNRNKIEDPHKKSPDDVIYEDYNSTFSQYIVYNKNGEVYPDDDGVKPQSELQKSDIYFFLFDAFKYYFEEFTFNKDKRQYEYTFEYELPEETPMTIKAFFALGFDSKQRLSYFTEEVKESQGLYGQYISITHNFSKYGESDLYDFPTTKPIVALEPQTTGGYKSAVAKFDGVALFGIRLKSPLKSQNQRFLLLDKDGKAISQSEFSLMCYLPGEKCMVATEPTPTTAYRNITSEKFVGKNLMLFQVSTAGSQSVGIESIALEFTPDYV